MLTAWNHDALLPDFMSYGCIMKSGAGEIMYDMGPDMHVEDKNSLLILTDSAMENVIERAKVVKMGNRRRKQEHIEDLYQPDVDHEDRDHDVSNSPEYLKNLSQDDSPHDAINVDTSDLDEWQESRIITAKKHIPKENHMESAHKYGLQGNLHMLNGFQQCQLRGK